MASANWYCVFHISCTVLFNVYFHNVISVFRTSIYAVFVIDRTRKETLLIKLFDSVSTKDLPLISQSKVKTVKAEKEEQYTLSNMSYIKLSICCFFFFDFFFEVPKMYTDQLNNICNVLHFFVCSFTKNMLLHKYFSRFLFRILS